MWELLITVTNLVVELLQVPEPTERLAAAQSGRRTAESCGPIY
jgi:hypothetical protein